MEQSETTFKVPFIAYESAVYQADKKNKRLWITTIILSLLMFGSSLCTGVLFLRQRNN